MNSTEVSAPMPTVSARDDSRPVSPSAGTHAVEKRWTPVLAKRFCPVSSAFLEFYHELKIAPGGRGLNSSEAMLLIHTLESQVGRTCAIPTVKRLAKRMGLSTRMVRSSLKTLEDAGFVRRDPMPDGGPNAILF